MARSTLSSFRRTLYALAKLSGDVQAVRTGRVPQRLVRRAVYRHTNSLARKITRGLGL